MIGNASRDPLGAASRLLTAAADRGVPGARWTRRFVDASRKKIRAHLERRRLRSSRFRWVREPATLRGRRVCLLAAFSDVAALSPHTVHLAEGWRAEGFVVILIVATNRSPDLSRAWRFPDGLDGVVVRDNCGYDFGSWSVAIRSAKGLRDASLLVLANDSVFGPLGSLHALVDRVTSSSADVVTMTESFETTHHFQSYLAFYKPRAIRHRAFRSFWKRCEAGDRQKIIEQFELAQGASLIAGGLVVEALFRQEPTDRRNPTLTRWRQLVEEGFPFVKISLLRENAWGADLGDWEAILRRHGYDPEIVRACLPADAAIHRVAS